MNLIRVAERIASPKINRTAGRIEFVRDQGPLRRDIRVKEFKWESDSLKKLAKILWAVEQSHSYGMAALRLFSKMPASEFSPDGLLGGRGYIQQVKEMRSALSNSVEFLSSFADTLHDEINAPHWSSAEEPEIRNIIQEAETIRSDQDQHVENQFDQQIDNEQVDSFSNPLPVNPTVEEDELEESEESEESEMEGDDEYSQYLSSDRSQNHPKVGEGSALPTDDGDDTEAPTLAEWYMNTTGRSDVASSSIPVETLSGPRVEHIGPGQGEEEFGYSTDDYDYPSDDLLGEGFRSLSPLYENELTDNTGKYVDPTRSDGSSYIAYSWLPGSRNEKLMPYYDRSVTAEDIEWMRQHDAPDSPFKKPKKIRPAMDPLWEEIRNAK